MTDKYSLIIEKALYFNDICYSICIKNELDIIINNIKKSWAH